MYFGDRPDDIQAAVQRHRDVLHRWLVTPLYKSMLFFYEIQGDIEKLFVL